MMGKVWAHDLPEYLEKWEVEFETYPRWELRSRSSGGFEEVLAVGTHHGGGGRYTVPENELYWMYGDPVTGEGGSPVKPIGNGLVHRSGVFTLGAAGATNTQGKGGPLVTSKGIIPRSKGNLFMFSIEAQNTGLGEPWTEDMLMTYFKVCAAVCDWANLKALLDIFTHAAYCEPSYPGRKIDPSGPTPSHPKIGETTGNMTWVDKEFNQEVYKIQPPQQEEGDIEMSLQYVCAPGTLWHGDYDTPTLIVDGTDIRRGFISDLTAVKEINEAAGRTVIPTVTNTNVEHHEAMMRLAGLSVPKRVRK